MTRTILAIETSNPSSWDGAGPSPCGIAVGRVVHDSNVVILAESALAPDNTREDALASTIERTLSDAGIRARDLSDVAVSIGPGGFTSVRIAVTTAKFIAEATGAACLPVPSARVAAPPGLAGAFGVALAAKGETVHLTLFMPPQSPSPRATPSSGGEIVDASSLVSALEHANARTLVSDRFLPESIRSAAGAHAIAIVAPAFSARACVREALHVDPVDPVALLPLYPREPEAVTKWRALHGG